ncbi:hypothetical protein IE53DRAFT_171537 [Violaceomyces palustris]|uniref:Uncharacterized protein n=1 Tax=Violaceomyces palustris TaxID=1673888 RepID=A0ACD0P609_9BASI|nr:hypothetical protein IE53DRAFT_171537 [Violaceomyces palustris]
MLLGLVCFIFPLLTLPFGSIPFFQVAREVDSLLHLPSPSLDHPRIVTTVSAAAAAASLLAFTPHPPPTSHPTSCCSPRTVTATHALSFIRSSISSNFSFP